MVFIASHHRQVWGGYQHSQTWGLNPVSCCPHSTPLNPIPLPVNCGAGFTPRGCPRFPFSGLHHPSGAQTVFHPGCIVIPGQLLAWLSSAAQVQPCVVFPGQWDLYTPPVLDPPPGCGGGGHSGIINAMQRKDYRYRFGPTASHTSPRGRYNDTLRFVMSSRRVRKDESLSRSHSPSVTMGNALRPTRMSIERTGTQLNRMDTISPSIYLVQGFRETRPPPPGH